MGINLLIQIIRNSTGIPNSAVITKKLSYPTRSTQLPAYPAINFGKNNIMEVKRAYCVAVNLIDVRPDKYITNAAPAKPLEMLSAVITYIKNFILISTLASHAKRRLLDAAIKAPKNNVFIVPNLIEKNPPNKPPNIVAKTPKNFEYVAISLTLYPFSI